MVGTGTGRSEVEVRFSQIRNSLDEGGYLESFGLDSLRLVEHLFGDLVKTTESLQKTLVEYSQVKKVADELECGVAPFKEENVRLHRENSQLRIALTKAFEDAEDQSRDPSLRVRDLEAENNDLKLLVSQFAERLKRAEAESLEKTKRIVKLQEKELCPTVVVKGKAAKEISLPLQKPLMEVDGFVGDACPQCIRLRNYVEYGKNTERNPKAIDYMKLADSRIEALQLQLRSFKNLEKENLALIVSLKSRVDARESEIQKLRDLIKVRPGRDNKVNSAMMLCRDESKELSTELKSAEMQLQVLQRRNIELEEKLKRSILQEHNDYMFGKTSLFNEANNVTRMFLEKELDKYPSHDKMSLLEKLYYLERQLSHCCKEKAVLRKQIDECKLKHTTTGENGTTNRLRPILKMPTAVKSKEKFAYGISRTSSSYRQTRPAKPAKVTEGVRKTLDTSSKKRTAISLKPNRTVENQFLSDDENEFESSASVASEDEGAPVENDENGYAESNQLVSDEEHSENGDEALVSEAMPFDNRGSRVDHQDRSVVPSAKMSSKRDKPFSGATKPRAAENEHFRKNMSSRSERLGVHPGQSKIKSKVHVTQDGFEPNRQCESPASAEYSNSDEDFNENNCDDNGNVELPNMTKMERNASTSKDFRNSLGPSRRVPSKPEDPKRVPKTLQGGMLNKDRIPPNRNKNDSIPARRGQVRTTINRPKVAAVSTKQTLPLRDTGKQQKTTTKSKGSNEASKTKTMSQNIIIGGRDDSIEDVHEEREEDVQKFGDNEFPEHLPVDDAEIQRADRISGSKTQDFVRTKNVPKSQGYIEDTNANRLINTDSNRNVDGISNRQAGSRQGKLLDARYNVASDKTNVKIPSEFPLSSMDADAMHDTTAYYDDDDDGGFDDEIASSNFVSESHGRMSDDVHDGAVAAADKSDKVSKPNTGISKRDSTRAGRPQTTIRDIASKSQHVDERNQQIRPNNTKMEDRSTPYDSKKKNVSMSGSQKTQKSTRSFDSRSQVSSTGDKQSTDKKYSDKNKGISAVKEPSLMSISEFEHDQSDVENTRMAPTQGGGGRDDGLRQSNPSHQWESEADSRANLVRKGNDFSRARGSSSQDFRNLAGETTSSNQGMWKRTSEPMETGTDYISEDQNFGDGSRGFVEREFNRGGGDDPVTTFGGSSVASFSRKTDDGTRLPPYMRGGISAPKVAENVDDYSSQFRSSNPVSGVFQEQKPVVRSVGVNTEARQAYSSWMDSRDDSQQKALLDKISTLQRKLDEVHAESSRHQLKSFELQGELERTKHMLQVEKQERDLAVTELKRVRELNSESTARMLMNSALGSDGSFRRGTTPMEMEREIVNLRSALASLDRDKDEMRVELDRKDERMARLTNEASKYIDEISQLKLRLKNAELQISHTGESAKEQNREVEFLKKQLESNRRDLEKTIRERDEALKQLHKLSATNAKGEMDRRSVETELELKNKEADELRKQVQRYIDEVRRIEELLLDKEEEMETIIQHYKSLTVENGNLEAQRTSLEREASSIRESVRDAVDQNISFKTHLASQNALIQSLEDEIQNLTQQISQLENQVESKSEKEKMLEADIKASKDLIYRLEVQMDKLKLDMADSESKRKQLEAENSELNAHISSLEARLNDETERQQQLENLVANSREKDFQLERTTMGISRERDDLAEKLTSLQQRSETLNSEVSRYRLKSIELQNELDRTRRQLDNEKRERETALTELRRVREQLSSSSANYLLNTALGTTGSSGSQFGGNISDSSIQHATTPSSGSTFRQNLFATEMLQRGTSREASPFTGAQGPPFELQLDPPMASSTTRREEQPGPSSSTATSVDQSQNRSKEPQHTDNDDDFQEWDSPVK